MPGSRCKICAHKKRGEAEAAIAAGESVRSVAKRLKLPYQSLDRHTRNCVPKALAKLGSAAPPSPSDLNLREVAQRTAEERDAAFADSLMAEVELLHKTTIELLRECREGCWLEIPDRDDPNRTQKIYDLPNVKNSLRAIAEVRKNLALIARLTGQMEPRREEANRTITFEEFEVLYLRAKREVRS